MGVIHCSEFTRSLHKFHRDFHNSYVGDNTLTGVVMTEVVSRIIMIGVTLLIHAEAVCRAIHAGFLEISRVCKMSNEELLQSDLELLKNTCRHTWTSFKAIFDLNTLQGQDPLTTPEELLSSTARPTVIYHDDLSTDTSSGFEDSLLLNPDSSYALDLSEGDATLHNVTPTNREGVQEFSDANAEEVLNVSQFFDEQASQILQDAPPVASVLREALLCVVPSVEPLVMPQMPAAQPVQVRPFVPAAVPLSPLAFGEEVSVVVAPVAPLGMPQMPEPQSVQVTPFVPAAVPLSPLAFGEEVSVAVAPLAPLGMPQMPEPQPVQVRPFVPAAVPLSPLAFGEEVSVVVAPVAPLVMPQMPEPQPVQVRPFVPEAVQLRPLAFGEEVSVVIAPVEPLVMPQMAAPQPVYVQPFIPSVPPGVRARAVAAAPVVAMALADFGIQIGELSPIGPVPLSPGADFEHVSLADAGLHIERLEMNDFPPPVGTADPGYDIKEEWFSEANAYGPQIEAMKKQSEELLMNCDHESVKKTLDANWAKAVVQASPGKEIQFYSGQHIKPNQAWQISKGYIETYPIGQCHYTSNEFGIEHLATVLDLTFQQKKVRAPLIGIFDPIQGPKAAQFLCANFSKALTNHLQSLPNNNPTPEGIWSGISLTFLQLNALFFQKFPQYAAQGSSATIVLELCDRIWIGNVGTSRAALHDQGRAFQCTSLDHCDSAFGLNGEKSALPEILWLDLEKIHLGSHIILGNQALFDQAGTAKIVEWIVKHPNKASLQDVARDIVYSVHQSRPKPPISCFVMSLNNGSWV